MATSSRSLDKPKMIGQPKSSWTHLTVKRTLFFCLMKLAVFGISLLNEEGNDLVGKCPMGKILGYSTNESDEVSAMRYFIAVLLTM